MNKKEMKKNVIPYVLLVILMFVLFYIYRIMSFKTYDLTYNEFMSNVNTGAVKEMVVTPSKDGGVYSITGTLKSYNENESFRVNVPLSDEVVKNLIDGYEKYDYRIDVKKDPTASTLLVVLVNFLPILLVVGGGIYFLSRQAGGANKSFDFGKSRARLSDSRNKVTFKDVAGLKEEKEEVKELID